VIGDCRFENEFDAFPHALRVRLGCPEEVRKSRCSMWRENTQHPSEIGLDKYAKEGWFDLYLHTDSISSNGAFNLTMAQLDKGNWTDKRKTADKNQSAKMEFEHAVLEFNEAINGIQAQYERGANFQWRYRDDGTKYIELADVAPIIRPSDDTIAKAKAEVPDIMKKAEELIAKPMETRPNVDGTGAGGSQAP
jgi:hypothetical protein